MKINAKKIAELLNKEVQTDFNEGTEEEMVKEVEEGGVETGGEQESNNYDGFVFKTFKGQEENENKKQVLYLPISLREKVFFKFYKATLETELIETNKFKDAIFKATIEDKGIKYIGHQGATQGQGGEHYIARAESLAIGRAFQRYGIPAMAEEFEKKEELKYILKNPKCQHSSKVSAHLKKIIKKLDK